MIKFNNVTKKYGKSVAVMNETITFEQGKIIGLLGPNGSGKSTSLKLMAGLVLPDKGEVSIDGKRVDRRIARKVAYLTEQDVFYDALSVWDMIKFYQSQFDDFEMEKAEKLLAFMKLDKNKKIKTLSKGNRGRLKLVQVLSRNADYILLDEPFSGLDPMVRDTIVRGLLNYVDFGKQTIIIATHEIDEIESLLDEVVLLKEGIFIAKQNVEEIREKNGQSVKEWMVTNLKE